MLTCRDVSEKASRLLDEDLGAVERLAQRAHLAACAHCARYMDQLARTVSLLPAAASPPPAPEAEARIMAALAAAAGGAERTAPAGLRRAAAALADALLIGLAGLLIWEVFARGIAPYWIGFALDPTTLIDAALDIRGAPAVAIHLCVGMLLFPVGFLLLVRPAARALAPHLPWWGLGSLYGAALWVLAGTLVANWMGGMPAFFGFGAVAWASLAGHAALGVSMAGAARYRAAA